MTDVRIEWGKAEHHARMADIAAVKSGAMSLEAAQKAARRRARQSGMTPHQAHMALVDGQRELRHGEGASTNPRQS